MSAKVKRLGRQERTGKGSEAPYSNENALRYSASSLNELVWVRRWVWAGRPLRRGGSEKSVV